MKNKNQVGSSVKIKADLFNVNSDDGKWWLAYINGALIKRARTKKACINALEKAIKGEFFNNGIY